MKTFVNNLLLLVKFETQLNPTETNRAYSHINVIVAALIFALFSVKVHVMVTREQRLSVCLGTPRDVGEFSGILIVVMETFAGVL